jgi:hypothetical protein
MAGIPGQVLAADGPHAGLRRQAGVCQHFMLWVLGCAAGLLLYFMET